jgi:hypothetical protein
VDDEPGLASFDSFAAFAIAFAFHEGHSKRVIDPGVEAEIERTTQLGKP